MKRAKAEVLRKINAGQICQIVCTAARLHICDLLYDGPKDLQYLSSTLKIHEEILYRFLMALIGTHLLKQNQTGHFELTEEGLYLCSQYEDSLCDIAEYKGSSFVWKAQSHLYDGLINNTSPFEIAFGSDLFSYLETHPDDSLIFQKAMSCYEQKSSRKIIEGYDFSSISTIVDLGGGGGGLLETIIQLNPHITGYVLNLPHAIRYARHVKPHSPVHFIEGSFFGKIPLDADMYILRNILHDWSDDKCLEILKNVRCQIPEKATLLVMETLIEKTIEARLGKFADLNMFVLTDGGKERTLEEFQLLFEQTGFNITNVIRTAASKALIEIKSKF